MSQFAGSQTSGPTIRQPTNHKLSSFAVFTVTLSAALVLSFPNPTQALLVTSDATETRALARLVQAASVAWQRGPQSQTWKGGEDARATKPPLGPNPPQLVEIETFKKQPNGNVSFEPISERALEEESEAEGGKVSAAKLSATPNEVKGTGLVGVLAGMVAGFAIGALSVRNKHSTNMITHSQTSHLGKSPQLEPRPPDRDLVIAEMSVLEGSCTNRRISIGRLPENHSLPKRPAQSDGDDELILDSGQDDVAAGKDADASKRSRCRASDWFPTDELEGEVIGSDWRADTPEPFARSFPFEYTSEPGMVNVVLENQTDRKVVLFAEDARPNADDSRRTAWKLYEGPSPPQLIQLRPNKLEVGARRHEGRHLVLRSGPFSAKAGTTWAMLQPAQNYTPWLREGRPEDDWAEDGPEDAITLLNLRQTPRAADDLELFVDGELCAVHPAVKRGPAVYFQAPNVLSFAVPRLGVDIKKGDSFDTEGDIEEAFVDLESPLLEGQKRVCWIRVTYDSEFDVCWQMDLLEI